MQLHVLNNCPTTLKQGRYNVRRDNVLLILFQHLQAKVPPSFCVTADLDGLKRSSDTPFWANCLLGRKFLECCDQKGGKVSTHRSSDKKGITGSLHNIQIGSRGFLDIQSLDYLFSLTTPTESQDKNNSYKQCYVDHTLSGHWETQQFFHHTVAKPTL